MSRQPCHIEGAELAEPGRPHVVRLQHSRFGRLGAEALWLGLGQGLTALGGLAAIRLLTAVLPQKEFGAGWLYLNGAGFAVLLLVNPLGASLGRLYHDEAPGGALGPLLRVVLKAEAAVLTGACAVFLPAAAWFGLLTSATWPIAVSLPVYFCALAFVNTLQQLLNTSRRRRRLALLVATEAWLKPCAAVAACLVWRPDSVGFVSGYALAQVIVALGGLPSILSFRGMTRSGPEAHLPRVVREVAAYSLPHVGLSACLWVLALSDRFLIGWMLGAEHVGIYVAGYQIGASAIQCYSGAFGPLLQPLIFGRAAVSKESAGAAVEMGVRAFLWTGLPLLALFIALHGWVLRWLADARYWEAAGVVLWVAFGIYFAALGDRAREAYLVCKRPGGVLGIVVSATVVNLLMNLVLIPRYGILGAAMSTCGAYATYAAATIFLGRGLLPWRFPLDTLAAAGFVSTLGLVGAKLAGGLGFAGAPGLPSAVVVLSASCAGLLTGAWGVRSLIFRDLRALARLS